MCRNPIAARSRIDDDQAMDDEEYARHLFEVLARPLDPDETVDEYGMGADLIDRYDGFGTEVRVTSIGVVPGEHGTQVEVAFAIDVPDDLEVPAEGLVLLPVAAEWRQAQGVQEPAAYAPWAARAILRAARCHIDAHRGAPREDAPVPDCETQRALLDDVLKQESAFGEGSFEEVAPGRFVVRRSPGHQPWTILVSPDQWEQVVRRHGSRKTWLLAHFSELLASGHHDDRFLVFWEGDLVRSIREELPPVDGWLRALLALRAAGPPHLGPGDGWFAYRPDTPED